MAHWLGLSKDPFLGFQPWESPSLLSLRALRQQLRCAEPDGRSRRHRERPQGRGGPTRDVAASPLSACPKAPCGHSRLSVRLSAWRVPGAQTAGKSRLSQHQSCTLPQRAFCL